MKSICNLTLQSDTQSLKSVHDLEACVSFAGLAQAGERDDKGSGYEKYEK